MRWIKKELDEDGKPEWTVYIDENGRGNEDDFVGYESFASRQEAIDSCTKEHVSWEDYDCNDK